MIANRSIDREKLIDALYEAHEHLKDAIRLLDRYVRETDDSAAEAYIVDHLRIMAGRDHNFLGRDLNIDDLIDRLNEYEEDEENEEGDETADAHNPLRNSWRYTPMSR